MSSYFGHILKKEVSCVEWRKNEHKARLQVNKEEGANHDMMGENIKKWTDLRGDVLFHFIQQ